MNIDIDKLLTAGRYAVTYAGGLVTALGLSSTVDPNALQSGFDHVFNGIKEIAVGVGILAPVAATAWGIFEQTVGRLVAKLHATAPDQLAKAVTETLPDSAKLRMVEAMPDVKSIVAKPNATDGVAAAVKDESRPKVVSQVELIH